MLCNWNLGLIKFITHLLSIFFNLHFCKIEKHMQILKNFFENGFLHISCFLEEIWCYIFISTSFPVPWSFPICFYGWCNVPCRQGWQQGNNRSGDPRCRARSSPRGRIHWHQGHRQWQLRRGIPSQTLWLGRNGRHQESSSG